MKKLRIVLALAVTALTITALAAPKSFWAGGGTDVGTSICYAVVTADAQDQGTPVLTFLDATSDKAGAVVQFYTVGTPTYCNYVSTTTSIPVASTNTLGLSRTGATGMEVVVLT